MSIAEFETELVYTTRSQVRSQRWRTWVLMLIFLGCGAAMGAGGVVMLRKDVGPPPLPPDRYVEMLRSCKFELSDEQADRIRDIVSAKRVEIESIRAEFWPRLRAVFVATDDEVRAVLGPEQEDAYRQWSAEMQNRWMPRPGQGPPDWRGPGDHQHSRAHRPKRGDENHEGNANDARAIHSRASAEKSTPGECCEVTNADKSVTDKAADARVSETNPTSDTPPPAAGEASVLPAAPDNGAAADAPPAG